MWKRLLSLDKKDVEIFLEKVNTFATQHDLSESLLLITRYELARSARSSYGVKGVFGI